jgi:hypothetical protein
MSVAGDRRDLRLNPKVYEKAVGLLRNNSEFTVAASLRQEESNVGTIVSFAHGTNRLVAEPDAIGESRRKSSYGQYINIQLLK